MNKIAMICISLLIIMVLGKGIVDFEYTQFKQSAQHNHQHQANLEFQPVSIKSQNLTFPQACHLIDQLKDESRQKQSRLIETDIDQYLQNMKQKFLELLTITQKLTNSQSKILHFEGLINKTNPVAPSKQKLKELESYERSLTNLTNLIRQKQQQLKQHFSQMNEQNDKANQIQSQRVESNFNIDLLKQKINYLKDLQQKVRSALSNMQPENDYNRYFDQLQREFNNQTLLIASIDSIIRKKDDLTKLKKQRANLESSITALDLYINDVGLCYQEKQNIRKQFKNHEKINQLISELRQLKMNEQPNIYCEGVVKKLTQKIKTMIRYYDIVASCASDLPEKVQSLKKQREDLEIVTSKIQELQKMVNFQEFEKIYSSQKDKIELMYSKIKEWKIKQYIHDPNQVAQIRQKAEDQLEKLLQQKKQTQPSTNQKSGTKFVSITIFNLIKQLKESKSSYCSLYQKYDNLANNVWSQAHNYQTQMNLKNKLLKLQHEEKQKYQQLNKQLIELRAEIYQKLNK